MGSAAITTVVKMMETLPENAQNLVVDHLREYIATMQDEDAWDTAFQKTQPKLAEAARAARQQIAAGQAKPMDYNRL
jgi:PHD/YefM family antitoxin component YafN of YafNO toxin-antitoxin module